MPEKEAVLEHITERETRGITIETRRIPTTTEIDSKHIDLRAIVSLISFSHPVRDYQGKDNSQIILKTTWFGQGGYNWHMWLEDERGNCINQKTGLNPLSEHFSSYTPERLKQWKNKAFNIHKQTIEKLEDLYWQGKEIPKDFL